MLGFASQKATGIKRRTAEQATHLSDTTQVETSSLMSFGTNMESISHAIMTPTGNRMTPAPPITSPLSNLTLNTQIARKTLPAHQHYSYPSSSICDEVMSVRNDGPCEASADRYVPPYEPQQGRNGRVGNTAMGAPVYKGMGNWSWDYVPYVDDDPHQMSSDDLRR